MRILKFIGYSFGNFANTIAYQIFGNRINFYYVDVLGLSTSVTGILWSIYGLWNAVNDPLMGQLSDRTRSKLGRRVPYVAFGAIPLGLLPRESTGSQRNTHRDRTSEGASIYQ